MVSTMKDLCRLCAKKDELCKDLLDEKNKMLLKMIQEFLNIHVSQIDGLPTKICINCEEKMVTFQLYVLECFKVQQTLRSMCMETSVDIHIKTEVELEDDVNFKSNVKVKEDLIAGEIVSDMKNVLECHDYDNDSGDFQNDESFDEQDDMAIASLKTSETELREKPKSLLYLEGVKISKGDIIKLQCNMCKEIAKSWASLEKHCKKRHKTKPIGKCSCGFSIKSNSVFYKHLSEHRRKKESKTKETPEISAEESLEQDQFIKLNVKSYVKFICPECKKVFKSWYSLQAHCSQIHEVKTVVRCVCGVSIKSKSALYKHIQDHKDPHAICCDKCPRVTKTLEAMEKHKMRHVPKSERKFYCCSCEKVFDSKEKLKSHERSHVPIEERKIHQCEKCDLKFTTPSSAAAHKRVVHDRIKSYVCDLCGYACGTSGELKQHRAIHSDEKPYVCNKCSKPFKTYANLKTHMDTHEDTSYTCYICNRVLNSRRTLRKHLLVHEDECKHVCSYCNRAFKRRQTLKVHMCTHTGDKPLSCKWCNENFAYASTLRSHRLRCHPEKMAPAAPVKLLMVQHGNIIMENTNQPYNYTQQTTHEQINYIKADGVQVEKSEVEAML